jgi:MFS family permease
MKISIERKAIASVVLGNALEFYDFTVYAYFAVPIGQAFFPSKNPTDSLLASLALFGIGYVMRPLGGLLIGAFADRTGRKPAMLLTMALMAIGMLTLAVAPAYEVLDIWSQVIVIIGRLIQGLALGGEVGPSTAYLLEAAPLHRRGFITSWQIASQGCAALFSGLLATALRFGIGDKAMDEWGWRLMFLIGISIVPIGLAIRKSLPESFGEIDSDTTHHSTFAIVRRLVIDHGTLLFLMFLVIAASTVSNSIGTNMPVYARVTLGFSLGVSTAIPIALGFASICFPLFGGWLTDHIGRRKVMIWPRTAIAFFAYPAFYYLVHYPSATAIYAVTFLMSALSSINAAAIIVGIPEALPKAVRSTGLAIIYALSVSIFGSSTNYVVNKLIVVSGDTLIPAYYLIAFSIVGTIAAMLIPETHRKTLE